MRMITNRTTSRLGRFFNKIKGLDYYLKALLIAIPFATILLIYLVSIGAADFIFSDWFVTLACIPTFFANQLSSAAYFGRTTDLITSFKRTVRKNRNELIGTLIGMACGIAVGIGLAAMHVFVPLTASLAGFATVLFTLRHMNIFAGLGNRVGRCTDKKSRPISEKVIVATCGLLGLTLGIVLFATCTAAMVSVVGITSFFSGGAAIPIWIAAIIFILAVSSGCASTADYISKGISFMRSFFIEEGMVTETVRKRKFEYGGSLLGVGIGLAVGVIVVTALVATNPALLVGIVGVVAGGLIIVTTTGIIGSIFSRFGRLIDGFMKKPELEGDDEEIDPLLIKGFYKKHDHEPEDQPLVALQDQLEDENSDIVEYPSTPYHAQPTHLFHRNRVGKQPSSENKYQSTLLRSCA